VDVHGLHEVDDDEVIVERLGRGEDGSVKQAGLGLQAVNSGNVALALSLGQGAPVVSLSVVIPMIV
jgi:hypothetical protein